MRRSLDQVSEVLSPFLFTSLLLLLLLMAQAGEALSENDVADEPGFVFDDPDSERWTPPPGPPGWRMVDRFDGFRFEVHGRVQGVWFRRSTQRQADELACFGWVQNTARGTVVGEARCGKLAGKKMREWLKHGPELAEVERLEIKTYEDTKIKLHFSDFAILEDERRTCFRDDGPHDCATVEAGKDGRDHPKPEL